MIHRYIITQELIVQRESFVPQIIASSMEAMNALRALLASRPLAIPA